MQALLFCVLSWAAVARGKFTVAGDDAKVIFGKGTTTSMAGTCTLEYSDGRLKSNCPITQVQPPLWVQDYLGEGYHVGQGSKTCTTGGDRTMATLDELNPPRECSAQSCIDYCEETYEAEKGKPLTHMDFWTGDAIGDNAYTNGDNGECWCTCQSNTCGEPCPYRITSIGWGIIMPFRKLACNEVE
jgi:hypothetical protein